MLITRLFVPALVLLSLVGCSSPAKQAVQIAPEASSAQYQSFSVAPIRAPGHRLDLEQRFTTAVIRALQAKGYELQQNADMQVIYALGLSKESGVELKPVQVAGATYTQTLTTEEERARLALRILDSRSKTVLFQVAISRQLHNPDMSQERFDQGVAKLLADFPDRR